MEEQLSSWSEVDIRSDYHRFPPLRFRCRQPLTDSSEESYPSPPPPPPFQQSRTSSDSESGLFVKPTYSFGQSAQSRQQVPLHLKNRTSFTPNRPLATFQTPKLANPSYPQHESQIQVETHQEPRNFRPKPDLRAHSSEKKKSGTRANSEFILRENQPWAYPVNQKVVSSKGVVRPQKPIRSFDNNVEAEKELGMYQTREEVIQKLLSSQQASSPAPNQDSGIGSSHDSHVDSGHRSVVRQKSWNETEKFFDDNLQEVYDKLPVLEKQIWGKLIVMEGHRRTAKAYMRHPLITIDGSDCEFDGMRIGISRFENAKRSDIVYEVFNEVLQGIKVKIDPDGNVWAKRMCYSPVFLKPLYRNKPNDLFIIDQRPVKVFDIRRFKEILVYELRQPKPDRRKLEKCCLICLKFSIDHYDLLRTPCYVILIHLVAMELLNLVLPKDHELSSPSSSFVAGGNPHHSRGRLSDQSPPNASTTNGFTSTPSSGHSGPLLTAMSPFRASGRTPKGGVFKRIIRKEEENIRGQHLMQQSAASHATPPSQNGFSKFHDTDDSDFDSLPRKGRHQTGTDASRLVDRDYASMLDLRQLGNVRGPPYETTESQIASSSHAVAPLRQGGPPFIDYSTPGAEVRHMGNRVFSMEALNAGAHGRERPRNAHHPMHAITGQHLHSQMDRIRSSKKWQSQDSGIGSGSYGSK